MRRAILSIGCCAALLASEAQTAPATYWVQFTDKTHTPYSTDHPEDFLSARAIERRQRQHIPIDAQDLPIDPAYISALLAAGQFELINRHKWFNAVTIRSTDTLALDTIAHLPFVLHMRCSGGRAQRMTRTKFAREEDLSFEKTYSDTYGASFRQISMMNGHLLHELGGARGEGMLIGVLDSGFEHADHLDGFSELRARNGIVLTRDLVEPGHNVYDAHWHGRSVLSCMAGRLPGRMLGTAPMADYVLLRTENADSEFLVEEDNWTSGAELADSIGCDVLNTSLGYTRFDDTLMDHTYADLNGTTTRISIAAGIASRKGMIPVNSAGNSGEDDWHYISAPADALDILAVGAVNDERQVAPFSSRGPSSDGRVKPDVCAVGWGAIGLGIDGLRADPLNGTSFSSPITCGLVACLWQLHPEKTAHEVMDAVRRSASHFIAPTDSTGYGIPDFWRAHLLLGGRDLTHLSGPQLLDVHPMPFSDHLDLEFYSGDATSLDLELIDGMGRALWSSSTPLEPRIYTQLRIEAPSLRDLANGSYVLHASLSGRSEMTRLVIKAP